MLGLIFIEITEVLYLGYASVVPEVFQPLQGCEIFNGEVIAFIQELIFLLLCLTPTKAISKKAYEIWATSIHLQVVNEKYAGSKSGRLFTTVNAFIFTERYSANANGKLTI